MMLVAGTIDICLAHRESMINREENHNINLGQFQWHNPLCGASSLEVTIKDEIWYNQHKKVHST